MLDVSRAGWGGEEFCRNCPYSQCTHSIDDTIIIDLRIICRVYIDLGAKLITDRWRAFKPSPLDSDVSVNATLFNVLDSRLRRCHAYDVRSCSLCGLPNTMRLMQDPAIRQRKARRKLWPRCKYSRSPSCRPTYTSNQNSPLECPVSFSFQLISLSLHLIIVKCLAFR
jgi:hypothetical protein